MHSPTEPRLLGLVGAPSWGVAMSELAEAGVRRVLDELTGPPEPLPELPRWIGVGARVDIAGRDTLYALRERD